jgi:chaperonin GroEL (HSP60 family)
VARKHLLVRSEAREKILHGCLALADAVRVTLGPKSKCVLIEKKWGRPIVCNDGVTIAKEFELKDPEENLGVQIMRQAAERTGEDVGDGTTTSTVDLIEAGIIDPTKVVRAALENAVSVASVLLLTEATLTEIPESKPEPASAADMP